MRERKLFITANDLTRLKMILEGSGIVHGRDIPAKVVAWSVPARLRRLLTENVICQPEAAGDFHL
jgi:hypothetical protein